MRILTSLSVAGSKGTVTLRRGDFLLDDYTNAIAMRVRVKHDLNNANAAAALTDQQRQDFLAGLSLDLNYGSNGQHKPLAALGFNRVQLMARILGGSEIEGYSDAATGLARNFTGASTVEYVLRVPLSMLWQDPQNGTRGGAGVFGMGPTQAKTVQAQFRVNSPTLPAGWTLTNTTFEIIPEDVPSRLDRWVPVPTWYENTFATKSAVLPAGLPLFVGELSAAHAASVLTNITTKIDGLVLIDQMGVKDYLSRLNDVPNFPAEALVTDRVTVLYTVPPAAKVSELPTGTPVITQNVQTLANAQFCCVYLPLHSDAEVSANVAAAAELVGNTVHAVNLAAALGVTVQKHVSGFLGFAVLRSDDAEAERFPSLKCAPKGQPAVYLPASAVAALAVRYRQRIAGGETNAADDEVKSFAAMVPGAQPTPRGFSSRTGPVVEAIRGALKQRIAAAA